MKMIQVFYREPACKNSANICNLIPGCTKISDINECISQIIVYPNFFFKNNLEFQSGWDKVVKISNGQKLQWFVNIEGMKKTFCFKGVPIPRSQEDINGLLQGVTIIQISDANWEKLNISVKDD